MKIVCVDGYTLNPGDLSWEKISALGELMVYDRTPMDQIVKRCEDADVVLSNKVPFTEETLRRLPKLKMISVLATGYNVIDVAAAKECGVLVCNAPAYGTDSVAQHTIALLLELANNVGKHVQSTGAGDWQTADDWCYTVAPVTELAGKTLGLVGFGNIGERVALIAKALGMNVIYHTPRKKETDIAVFSDLNTLFSKSDFISLHCPLTADNQCFVNKELLLKMKTSAMIINTARGQLINELDLANALNQNIIAGAALDVLSKEPPPPGNPLLNAKNCILSPHIAWISKEARIRVMDITEQNIKGFLDGKVVNGVV